MGSEPPVEHSFMFPTVPMDHLQPAQARQADPPTFGRRDGGDWATPNDSFGISNDGGRCWVQLQRSFQRDPFVPDVRMVWPPADGEAEARWGWRTVLASLISPRQG